MSEQSMGGTGWTPEGADDDETESAPQPSSLYPFIPSRISPEDLAAAQEFVATVVQYSPPEKWKSVRYLCILLSHAEATQNAVGLDRYEAEYLLALMGAGLGEFDLSEGERTALVSLRAKLKGLLQ